MMQVTFIYSTNIVKNHGKYFNRTISNKTIKRYKSISNDFTFAGNVIEDDYGDIGGKMNELDSDIKIFDIPNLHTIKGFLFPYVSSKAKLEYLIKNSDLVIIRLPSEIGNVAIKIAQKYKKKYIVEVVGCAWDSMWNHSLKGKILAPLLTYRMKKSIKKAECVVYVTEEFLQKRYPTQGLSYSISDVNIGEINSDTIKTRYGNIREMGKRKKFLIGTIGPLNIRYKGQEKVIKAIKYFQNSDIDIEYQLVGGGNEDRLKKIAKKIGVEDKVKFIGSLPHKEVLKWLEEIDIYIQPSDAEGLPRSLIEAMSKGCLCMGSNVGGIPELLNVKYVFKKNKIKEIYNILKSINIDELKREADNNINKCKIYSENNLFDKQLEFYKRYIERI